MEVPDCRQRVPKMQVALWQPGMAILDFRRSIDRHRVAQSVFGRIMRPHNPHETSSRFRPSDLSPHKLILANDIHSVGLLYDAL